MLNYVQSAINSRVQVILLIVLAVIATDLHAEQGSSNTLQFVPPNYSPYEGERSELPQSREQLLMPYTSQQPATEAPQYRRPYAVLPPSGSGYGYNSRPYYGGNYPGGYSYPGYGSPSAGWGNMPWGGGYPGGFGGSPWGVSPWGGSPWGGSPWGGSPWGGSPWGNSFSFFGPSGGFPFGL